VEEKPSIGAVAMSVEAESEIDLVELFYRILEKVWYIVAAAVAVAAIAGVHSQFFATPMYEATSKLYVLSSKDSVVNLADLQIGSQLTNDYQEIFKVWEVNAEVLQRLGLEDTYTLKDLQAMLTIGNPTNTRILYITVKSDDPQEAVDIADAFAGAAQRGIKDRMGTDEPMLLSNARLPTSPFSPNKTRNILLGGIIGAMLAMGIIFLRFIMDDKLKSADDLARYVGIPTLAVVPMLGAHSGHGGYDTYTAKRHEVAK
jgi:capsular polysaccharide biosynthesis protein